MDDLMLVRDLYGEVAPDPRLEAEVRARLAGLATDRGDEPAGDRRRVVPRRRAAFGLGLVAAAAAAAVGVATLGGTTSPASPRHRVQAQPTELSARTILLAAAEKAVAEPVGRYWRVHTTDGQSYHVGPANGGYTVVGYASETSTWAARSASDSDVYYLRDLGAYPLTAADKAAWKKAGSPSTWRVWSNDHYATLSPKPGASYGTGSGAWSRTEQSPAFKKKDAAERKKRCAVANRCQKDFNDLSQADRQKLASDPAMLNTFLFPHLTQVPPRGRGLARPTFTWSSSAKLMEAYAFLTARPASPELRAAVFRLLATMPDVRSIGKVQDAKGRTGIGLAVRAPTQKAGDTTFDAVLVLDPKTYQVLGEQWVVVKAGRSNRGMQPGTIFDQQVALEAGWTNETPHHP